MSSLRMRNKIKNFILKSVTAVMVVVFLLSGATLDSKTYIPFITLCVSGVWLFLFIYANDYDDEKDYEE